MKELVGGLEVEGQRVSLNQDNKSKEGRRETAWLDTKKDNLCAKAAPSRHAASPGGRCS